MTIAPFSQLCSRFKSLICLAVCAAPLITGCDDRHKPVVKIGYMICNSESETLQRFLPLTRYLSDRTGIEFIAVPVDTQDFERRFKAGEFAFTHTNSLLYVILREKYQLAPLAAERRGNFGVRTAGVLISRKDSGITSLAHVRGRKVAFGPMLAPTGYLAEYDLLLRSGIDPEKDLAPYTIPSGSFKHEKLVYGVLYGQYDVAATPLLDLEVMAREGKITPDDFTIIAQTELIPYCTVGAAPSADPQLIAKVQQALVELKESNTVELNGERLKVLKSSWVDGFEPIADSAYDPIRAMARRTNMPPYQKY
ncbi:MAG TPA: phosphate/phosphite/phosphonate ABC transporter substrate-binding protein [Geobacteraceae bacterium]